MAVFYASSETIYICIYYIYILYYIIYVLNMNSTNTKLQFQEKKCILREESRGENRKSVVHESMTKNLISGTSYACGNITKSGEKQTSPTIVIRVTFFSKPPQKKSKKKICRGLSLLPTNPSPKPPKVGKKKI